MATMAQARDRKVRLFSNKKGIEDEEEAEEELLPRWPRPIGVRAYSYLMEVPEEKIERSRMDVIEKKAKMQRQNRNQANQAN